MLLVDFVNFNDMHKMYNYTWPIGLLTLTAIFYHIGFNFTCAQTPVAVAYQ